MKVKLLGIAEAVLLAIVIVAGAIALPILCRPFYYGHIGPMGLPERADLTAEQVKTAYNEVLDYCTGVTDAFSAGELPFSEEGASHFADVRKLFLLDLWALAVAAVLLIALKWFGRKKPCRLLGHTPGFWSAVSLGVTFVTVAALAAIDFDRAFEVFHRLFFPGIQSLPGPGDSDAPMGVLPQLRHFDFCGDCAVLRRNGHIRPTKKIKNTRLPGRRVFFCISY